MREEGLGEHLALFDQLVAQGVLLEEDRLFWEMITPQRAHRMLTALRQRTRYITVVLEAVDDGHNQAAVLRSADAFGVQEIAIITGQAPFAPSENVTQGAHKWLTLHRYPDITAAVQALRAQGYRIWASQPDPQAVPIDQVDLTQPAAFLFGNEHAGLSDQALTLADNTFVIPMVGFVQSLNVSVAAAITLFHTTRRARSIAGDRYPLPLEKQREVLRRWLRTATPGTRRIARTIAPP